MKNKSCLAIENPALALEWNRDKNGSLTPYDISPYSNKKVWWTCKNGHEWMASVNSRNGNNSGYNRGCPYCSGKYVCIDNCLATLNPKLAKEWHPTKNGKLTPYDVTCGSSKKVWWICKNGHEWLAVISSRVCSGRGCPYCTNQKVCLDNCLLTKNPELAKEWDYEKNFPLTPKDVLPCSLKDVWWICKNGHSWKEKISSRNVRGKTIPCQYCCSNRVSKENCLFAQNPQLSKEWHPTKNGKLTPYNVFPYSGIMAHWKCHICGFEWIASINNRNGKGRGCSNCKKYILSDGIVCDSLIEAFYYLKFKSMGIKFIFHFRYTKNRKYNCDFYIPSKNKYIEVTSYTMKSRHGPLYFKGIKEKRKIVKRRNASFELIQRNLTPKELKWIKGKIVNRTFGVSVNR